MSRDLWVLGGRLCFFVFFLFGVLVGFHSFLVYIPRSCCSYIAPSLLNSQRSGFERPGAPPCSSNACGSGVPGPHPNSAAGQLASLSEGVVTLLPQHPVIMSLSCLILGSTGETGKHVLLSALANPAFKAVHALGRKPPSVDATAPGFEKLITTPSLDFDSLLSGDGAEALKLKVIDSDVVLVTLGTTRAAAGSAEAFVKIDR